jgi:hypothetical protein
MSDNCIDTDGVTDLKNTVGDTFGLGPIKSYEVDIYAEPKRPQAELRDSDYHRTDIYRTAARGYTAISSGLRASVWCGQ